MNLAIGVESFLIFLFRFLESTDMNAGLVEIDVIFLDVFCLFVCFCLFERSGFGIRWHLILSSANLFCFDCRWLIFTR